MVTLDDIAERILKPYGEALPAKIRAEFTEDEWAEIEREVMEEDASQMEHDAKERD